MAASGKERAEGEFSALRAHMRNYGDSRIDDYGVAQMGDHNRLNIYLYINSNALDAEGRVLMALLESLAFPRLDSRLRYIAPALPTTCKWLVIHIT